MKQHRFDPLSFVFGLLFLGVGVPILFSESGLTVFQGRWILPGFLIVVGAVVLASTRSRTGRSDSIMSETSIESDLDATSD